ncbi:hypothetical protein OIT44_06960 [Weissella ceti]|uniref:Uncharacterized protein n=1 Tax=Weissella ceti TaxID=759620 RepID=A0ABT3E5U7_9LACO|nr:hypothetical protein [Weissella ceti]MCW0953787.1 hypothetical protein [Weissella ceti]QVK11872.1 hypothetical protein KHQ31_06585 [Weissella ceti]
MQNIDSKPWSFRWLMEHLGSAVLLIGAVTAAAVALTTLIIGVEELISLIVVQRPINTYTNAYGNALQTVLWHFLIVFVVVAFWAALDTFTAEPTE